MKLLPTFVSDRGHRAHNDGIDPRRRVSRLAPAFQRRATLAATVAALALCGSFAIAAEPSAYNPRDFGARGDGQAKDTAAIQAAIDAAARAGGGTVRLTAGRYLCGTLHLCSQLTFRLESGAILVESKDDRDFDHYEALSYDPHAAKDTAFMHFALLAGDGIEDIAIEGRGVLDGNHTKRGGPKPISLKRCRHITIRDVSIQESPNYSISLLGCDHVNIEGVTIRNSHADGIDPDCCRYVRISGCRIDAHDDAIVLKSSPSLGAILPTEYVAVTNCILSTDCNYFKMGTESSGAFRRIALSNCAMVPRTIVDETDLNSSGVAIETVDGADVDGVVVSNVTMDKVCCPLFIRLGNRGRAQKTPTPGTLRNVSISHIVAIGSPMTSSITGLPGHTVQGVTLSDISVSTPGDGRHKAGLDVPEVPGDYPDSDMFGPLPATGLYLRHVAGLTLRAIRFDREKADARPLLVADDVRDVDVNGLRAGGLPSTGVPIWMNNACAVQIRGADFGSVSLAAAVRLTGACREVLLRDR